MAGVEPAWGLAPGDWHRDSYPTVLIPIGGAALAAHGEGEEGNPLLLGLDYLASLDQLAQQSRTLLTSDTQLGGNVTATLALGAGQFGQDGVLDLGIFSLLLGGLTTLGVVTLFQLLAQRDQLFHMLVGDTLEGLLIDGGQNGVDGGDVGGFGGGHSIYLFLCF